MWKKYIVTFFPVTFCTDATHTYDIILYTDTISILIPYSQYNGKQKIVNVKLEKKRKKENNSVYYFRVGFRYAVAILLNAGLI